MQKLSPVLITLPLLLMALLALLQPPNTSPTITCWLHSHQPQASSTNLWQSTGHWLLGNSLSANYTAIKSTYLSSTCDSSLQTSPPNAVTRHCKCPPNPLLPPQTRPEKSWGGWNRKLLGQMSSVQEAWHYGWVWWSYAHPLLAMPTLNFNFTLPDQSWLQHAVQKWWRSQQ